MSEGALIATGINSASAEVGAIAAEVVRLVGPPPVRALARPAEAQPRNPDGFQDRFELRGVAPLPGCDHDGQGLLPLLDCELDFAGQSAVGAPKASDVHQDCCRITANSARSVWSPVASKARCRPRCSMRPPEQFA